MIASKIAIGANEIQNLKRNELKLLDETIKQDFVFHNDFVDFNISNLLEYSLDAYLVNIGSNDTLQIRKDKAKIVYKKSNNETQELNIVFRYVS